MNKIRKQDIEGCTVYLKVMARENWPMCHNCVAGVHQDECMVVLSTSYYPRCPLKQRRDIYVLKVD